MLTGRVQKLIITAVIGVYDEQGRLVGEANAEPRVFYAAQATPTISEMLDDTITDQAALERVRAGCATTTNRTTP